MFGFIYEQNAKYLDTNILFTVRIKDLAMFNLVKLACAQWAATWTRIKILEFFFLNELWQFNKHSLKPRNPKFHKILIKTFQVLRVFVQVCANFS